MSADRRSVPAASRPPALLLPRRGCTARLHKCPWRHEVPTFGLLMASGVALKWVQRHEERTGTTPSPRLETHSESSGKHVLADTCANLTELHARARRQRQRVSCILVIFGFTVFFTGLVMGFLRMYGFLDARVGPDGAHFAYGLPGIFPVFLAVQPIDTKLIRYTVIITILYCFGGTCLILVGLALASLGLDYDADRTCAPVRGHDCIAYMWHWSLIAGVNVVTLVALIHTECHARHALTPRVVLRRVWLIMRACHIGWGLVTFTYVIVRSTTESNYAGSSSFWGDMAHGITDLVFPLLLRPEVRRHVTKLLHRMAGDRDDERAAAIAAMVGGVGVEKAAELAEKSFRAIPHEKMKLVDFLNSDLASSNDDLRARTISCQLGFCDAFMSHSWRDDAGAKWHTLSIWAEAFREHSGHSPLLWFDRACLDQSNIDASLSMLPVYLSGCRLLLILAGQTYTERLWCVMEVFTWLSIQKDAHRLMSVHPIVQPMHGELTGSSSEPDGAVQGRNGEGPQPGQALWASASAAIHESTVQAELARANFVRFRAQNAQCFKAEDRDRLLAIIESAFGTFQDFDGRVRVALVRQSKASLLSTRNNGSALNLYDVAEIAVEASKDISSRPLR